MTITEKDKNLDKLLKHKTNYTYKYLRKNLGFSNDVKLMKYLIQYFNKKLDNYNFESDVLNNKYLSKIVKYYGYSLGKINLSNKDLEELIPLFININNKIKKIIIENINNYSTIVEIDNSILLMTIEESIKDIISEITKRRNLNNKLEIISDNKLVDILKNVVFYIKDITILESLLENFPNLPIIKDFDGNLVFEKVLDKYFNNLVNKCDYNNKIYYDKVVDLLSNYLYLADDNIIEEIFYKKMKSFIKITINKDFEQSKKNYIISDINERIKQFELGSKIDFLSNKDNDSYYKSIDFDSISSLVACEKVAERFDMTDRHVITIDNNNAKIFENALSIERKDDNYLLTIYVTDISSFISDNKKKEKKKYETILDNSATSMLFSNKYKNNHCKLLKDKEVPVIAYQFLVDEDFRVMSFDFKRALIKVRENLKFSDFNNFEDIKNDETKNIILQLFELTEPFINISSKINENTIDTIISIINIRTAREIAKYAEYKNLPMVFQRYKRKEPSEIIDDLEEKYDVKLDFLRYDEKINAQSIYTIGNDIYQDVNKFNIRVYSPLRKIDGLINQMLINIYLVDHNKINDYTKNYLESRLDKICSKLNRKKFLKIKEENTTDIIEVKRMIKKTNFDN